MLRKNSCKWPIRSLLITFCLLVLPSISTNLNAQEKAGENLRNLYLETARTEAYNKKYNEALQNLDKALAIDPYFLEAKTYKARVLGFAERYEDGIALAKDVLRQDRQYIPAYICLGDLYYCSKQPRESLTAVSNGLYYNNSNIQLLEKKADLEYQLGLMKESAETTSSLLYYDPTNEKGLELKGLLKKEIKKHNVGVVYNFDSYTNILGNANALSYYYTKESASGPWTIRLNQAIRRGQVGFQVEADWYPRISKRSYLYLNMGFSGSDLFPQTRAGAELFHNLGKGWEGSLGFRYLKFNQNVKPVLLTAQLGKYWGNNWASLRGYIGFDDSPGTTRSMVFLYRRYLKSENNWIGLIMATGYLPDLNGVQNAAFEFNSRNFQFLKTRRFGVTYQHEFNKAWWARFAIGVGQTENELPVNTFRSFVWGSIQLNYRF